MAAQAAIERSMAMSAILADPSESLGNSSCPSSSSSTFPRTARITLAQIKSWYHRITSRVSSRLSPSLAAATVSKKRVSLSLNQSSTISTYLLAARERRWFSAALSFAFKFSIFSVESKVSRSIPHFLAPSFSSSRLSARVSDNLSQNALFLISSASGSEESSCEMEKFKQREVSGQRSHHRSQ